MESDTQEIIDELKENLKTLNSTLQKCRLNGINVDLTLNTTVEDQDTIEQFLHFGHKRENYIKFDEAYKINKFK